MVDVAYSTFKVTGVFCSQNTNVTEVWSAPLMSSLRGTAMFGPSVNPFEAQF